MMTPFITALFGRKKNKELFRELWDRHTVNKIVMLSIILLKLTVCVGFVMYILLCVFPQFKVWILLASIFITTAIMMIQGFKAKANMMEQRFIANFNSKEMSEESVFDTDSSAMLTNNNIHLEEIVVAPDALVAGKTLAEFGLSRLTHTSIVSIERGSGRINIPGKETMIFPYDRLIVAATDEELSEMMTTFGESRPEQLDAQKSQISISLYEIDPESSPVGKTIKELEIRTKTQCMIIGIDRKGVSLPKISGDTVLQAEDILWLAGEEDRLNNFKIT
jgi:CPA2 family monovalent cation:H+ antiporter-2